MAKKDPMEKLGPEFLRLEAAIVSKQKEMDALWTELKRKFPLPANATWTLFMNGKVRAVTTEDETEESVPRQPRVLVLGQIWQPGMGVCGYQYHPGCSQLQPPLTAVTREAVAEWLKLHAGDFQSITDFCVTHWHGAVILSWEKPESEAAFDRCMGLNEG